MEHYLTYHNPDAMGWSASEIEDLCIVTDKPAPSDLQGATVWLLTGEGRPRSYYLVARFIVDAIESGAEDGFATKVSGTEGGCFKPMVCLDGCPWLKDLKRSQGNFAFGLQRITDQRFIDGLLGVSENQA